MRRARKVSRASVRNSGAMLGTNFEREIREQPDVWERLARSGKAAQLAGALGDDVILIGSGSSLFAAELGALALRRRAIRAQAVPATEARLDHCAFEHKTVIAISQSGRSADLFDALDVLLPNRLIALTNNADSPLAAKADTVVDVGAGREIAVPASKSVTATVAILLWAASLAGGEDSRSQGVLEATARDIRRWLQGAGVDDVAAAGAQIAQLQSAIVLGSDYGLPVARETALKLKEASYLHAEGFAAGEFRHGSVAMVDASCAVIAIVDDDALPVVRAPMREVEGSGALRYAIGTSGITGVQRLGPSVAEAYNTLAWLVTAQLLALHTARARGVESDAPRGLVKALTLDPGV
jgi:glutamine---fructose-6-phosphate transaminase (isomerizing)